MADTVLHALAFDDTVRVIVADCRETVQQAVRIHRTEATASAALGRALISARLLAGTLKGAERIGLQLHGGGPIGALIARSTPAGDVYGTIGNPHVHLPPRADGKLDVGGAVGTAGHLMVTRDMGLREPWVGTVPLVSGEIGDDVAHYLAASEQVMSALAVGVRMGADGEVLAAGGFLVQLLGGLDEETVAGLEARVLALANVSDELDAGNSAEDLLRILTADRYRALEHRAVRYHAPHDRDYYVERLRALDRGGLAEVFADDEQIELTCDFTRETWTITRQDVGLDAAGSGSGSGAGSGSGSGSGSER